MAMRFSAAAFLNFSPWSDLGETRGADIDNGITKDGVQLTGYEGYSLYDKREYRVYGKVPVYDEATGQTIMVDRLVKKSSGGRGKIQSVLSTLTAVGTHTEDIYHYNDAGEMTGFTRYYAWSAGVHKIEYTADGLRIIDNVKHRDSSGRVTQADFMKSRYLSSATSVLEQSIATYYFDYVAGERRVQKIEHVVWDADPAHPTDHRYDIRRVIGIDTYIYDPANPTKLLEIHSAKPGTPTIPIFTIHIDGNIGSIYVPGLSGPVLRIETSGIFESSTYIVKESWIATTAKLHSYVPFLKGFKGAALVLAGFDAVKAANLVLETEAHTMATVWDPVTGKILNVPPYTVTVRFKDIRDGSLTLFANFVTPFDFRKDNYDPFKAYPVDTGYTVQAGGVVLASLSDAEISVDGTKVFDFDMDGNYLGWHPANYLVTLPAIAMTKQLFSTLTGQDSKSYTFDATMLTTKDVIARTRFENTSILSQVFKVVVKDSGGAVVREFRAERRYIGTSWPFKEYYELFDVKDTSKLYGYVKVFGIDGSSAYISIYEYIKPTMNCYDSKPEAVAVCGPYDQAD